MLGKCSKEGGGNHKKLKPKGDIDLRVNALIGNTKESHLQVGRAEIKSGTPVRSTSLLPAGHKSCMEESLLSGDPHDAQR